MSVSGLETDYLTTNPSEGFINLVNEKQRSALVSRIKKGLEGDSFICIDTDFLMLDHQSPDKINYIVPYSLHSNYK